VPPLAVVLLTTPRLILRRFRDSDAEPFASYRSDPAIARYQSWDAPFPVSAARTFVHGQAAADPAQPGWFQYAIELRSDGSLAGDVGVNLHENRMQAEIGFTLAAAYQGQGYATEAVGRVLTQLFTAAGLVRVSAECDARNDRSARLLERLGFRREGLRVRNTWIKGEWTDDLLFGLLAQDWRR
jgi:aminoglycoside 6'-N-acetyltransferase